MSSAAAAAAAAAHEYGAPADDHQKLLHHRHQQQQQQQQIMYHVPQYSRREKLRFPHEDPYYSQNTAPHDSSAVASTFDPLFSISNGNPSNYHYTQLPQPFTLTLSSPSAAAALHPVQLGPFTGYATVLSRSRYLDPARQLLEEIARDACGQAGQLLHSSSCSDLSEENLAMDHQILGAVAVAAAGEQQQQWRKTRLISMLDEVCRRYKQYYQQLQTVISLFESVPGLSSAAPCASMALKVISKQFMCLKNVISEQLHHINKTAREEGLGMVNGEISTHKNANDIGTIKQSHVWKPQRGLPERAVAVLRAWLFEHFLHPYPTDADKQMLATQTGLMRNQVSNWFINARVRLWKPMVEEVHSLEIRQQNDITDADKHATLPPASTATSSNELPLENQSSKRPRDDLTQMSNHIGEPYNQLIYDGIAIRRPDEENVAVNGDVSLTLGLHQHNGVYLTGPLPMSVRGFGTGVEECNDAYVIGSFEGQGRNFEKYIDGHYLHDFVG